MKTQEKVKNFITKSITFVSPRLIVGIELAKILKWKKF